MAEGALPEFFRLSIGSLHIELQGGRSFLLLLAKGSGAPWWKERARGRLHRCSCVQAVNVGLDKLNNKCIYTGLSTFSSSLSNLSVPAAAAFEAHRCRRWAYGAYFGNPEHPTTSILTLLLKKLKIHTRLAFHSLTPQNLPTAAALFPLGCPSGCLLTVWKPTNARWEAFARQLEQTALAFVSSGSSMLSPIICLLQHSCSCTLNCWQSSYSCHPLERRAA